MRLNQSRPFIWETNVLSSYCYHIQFLYYSRVTAFESIGMPVCGSIRCFCNSILCLLKRASSNDSQMWVHKWWLIETYEPILLHYAMNILHSDLVESYTRITIANVRFNIEQRTRKTLIYCCIPIECYNWRIPSAPMLYPCRYTFLWGCRQKVPKSLPLPIEN